MRGKLLAVSAVSIAILLVASGVLAAYYRTVLMESLDISNGHILAGNMGSLANVDGNVLKMNESKIGGSTPILALLSPLGDVFAYRWSKNCPTYAACLDDVTPDGNTTIDVADAASGLSYYSTLSLYFPKWNDSVIDKVIIFTTSRRNTTVLEGAVSLIDNLTGESCYSTSIFPSQAFDTRSFQIESWRLCPSGQTLQKLFQHGARVRLQSEFQSSTWTVTTLEIAVFYETVAYVYTFSGTFTSAKLSTGEIPTYLNWTCNATGDIWRLAIESKTGWVFLYDSMTTVCSVGAQTSYSKALSSTFDYNIGGRVLVALSTDGNPIAAQDISFDRLVVVVYGPTSPELPTNYALGLPWLAILLIFLVPVLYFAVWWRRRREG